MKNILRNSNFGFTKWCVALALTLALTAATGHSALSSVSETFEDNNISSNPAWSGGTSSFTIGSSSSLVGTYDLRGNTAGSTASISTPIGTTANLAETDCSWTLIYRDSAGNPGGAPGTGVNGWRFWLAANGTDPASAQGYALRQGNSSTPDNIVLVRMNGSSETVLITGIDPGTTAYSIRVTRSAVGLWTLYMDSGTSGATTSRGTAITDTNYLNSGSSTISMIVHASNSTGSGNPQRFRWDNITFTGPASVTTPGAPTITNVVSGDQTLSTYYSPGSGSPTNYQYSTNGTNGPFTAFVPPQTNNPLVISNLANGTAYSISFKAVNAGGTSTNTAATNGTPYTTPAAPTVSNVTSGDQTLSVAFTAGTNNGNSITNYQYSTNGGINFSAFNPAQTNSPLTISNLANGTTYSLSLKAVNAAGAGAASTPATSGTPYTTPAAPTGLSVTNGNGQVTIAFTAGTNNGSTITNYQYSIDGGTNFAAFSPPQNASPVIVSGLTNGTNYSLALKAMNAAGDGSSSEIVSGSPEESSSPTISVQPLTLASAMTTTYGAASSEKSFSVSGTKLNNGDLTVTAPPGMQVALSGGEFGASVTLPVIGDSVSATTVRVRLAANAPATGSYDNVSIPVSGGGASDISVLTASTGNQVLRKALTISGLTASDRAYNGQTDAPVNGTPALTSGQVVELDDVGLSGTATYAFSEADAGNSKPITITNLSLSGASKDNYSLTLPSLSASINQVALTITGLTAVSKNYDGSTTVSVTGTPAFSGLVNSESFTPSGSVTWAFTDATPGINKALVRTGDYAVPSGNYSLTQPSLTASITALVPGAPTITRITGGEVSGQLSVAFTAPTNDGGSAITNYKYSTNGGSTWTAVSPEATTSPILISGLNNGTTYDVQIRAVNVVGDGAATASTPGTPSVPPVYKHDFGTAPISSKPYTAVPAVINANLSNSSWTTSASAFTSYNGSAGLALALNNTGSSPTFTLTFDVAPGYQLDVTGLSYWRQRSTTGSTGISITINGGSAVYSESAVPTAPGSNVGLQAVTGKTGLTGTVTVVLTMTGGASGQTFRLDDFTLEGTVTSISQTPPTITSTNAFSGTVGVAFSNTITATGSSPIVFSGTGLPNGLSVATNGVISGTPTAAGTNNATLTATNAAGTNNQVATFTIAKGTPSITAPPTASAITAVQALSASILTEGTASVPGTFAWTTSSTVPGSTGVYGVTFTPRDSANYNTTTVNVSVTVNPAPVGTTYNDWLQAQGVTPSDPNAAMLDYAFGATTLGALDSTLKPSVAIVPPTGGAGGDTATLVLTYYVREGTRGLTVTPNLSLDLSAVGGGFVPLDPTQIEGHEIHDIGGGVSVKRMTASVPMIGDRKFLKLEVLQE